jgi:hypothetical protein
MRFPPTCHHNNGCLWDLLKQFISITSAESQIFVSEDIAMNLKPIKIGAEKKTLRRNGDKNEKNNFGTTGTYGTE